MKRLWLTLLVCGIAASACQSTSPGSASQPAPVSVSPTPSPAIAATPDESPSPELTPPTATPIPTITAPPPASPSPDRPLPVVPSPTSPSLTPPSPTEPSVSATPTPTVNSTIAPGSSPPSGTAQVYHQPDGLFEILLPPRYTYREIEDGVSFISGDRRFGGSVNVVSAEGQTLTDEMLEAGLKEEYENRLKTVQWQASTPQADGSIRVDWLGVDTNDDVLDSVSFVEQHGDYIYILNLHAINEAYANHEEAATTIVENYRLRLSE